MMKSRTYTIKPELYKLPLSGAFVHLGTEYKASLKRDMSDPIVYSYTEDAITKKELSFNVDVDDDVVIYATTNIKIKDGVKPAVWCGESGIAVLTTRKEIATTNTIIVTPRVTIDELYVEGGFTLTGSEFIRYDGVGEHTSTSYRIENELTGEVVFERKKDKDNLYKFTFPIGILKAGNIYRILMRYHDSLNSMSNYGSMIYTLGYSVDSIFPMDEIEIPYENYLNLTGSNTEWLPGFKVEMELFADIKDMNSIEYTKAVVTANGSYLITSDGNYVLVSSSTGSSVLDINGKLIDIIEYDNGFMLNSINYEVGDILFGRIKIYNDDISIVKGVKIFISKFVRDSINDTDETMTLNFNQTLLSNDTLTACMGFYEQDKNGNVHQMKYGTWDMYKYNVDDTNKVSDGVFCMSLYTDEIEHTSNSRHSRHSILENPYGGLVAFTQENVDMVSGTANDEYHSRIKFINVDNNGVYSIVGEIKSTLMFTGIHIGSGYFVEGQYLYFIPMANYSSMTSTSYSLSTDKSGLYRIDLKNHTLEKLLTISNSLFTGSTLFYGTKLIVNNGIAWVMDARTTGSSNVYRIDLSTNVGVLSTKNSTAHLITSNATEDSILYKFYTKLKSGKIVLVVLNSTVNAFKILEVNKDNIESTNVLYDGTGTSLGLVATIGAVIKLRNGGMIFGSYENPSKLYLLS